MKLCLPMILSLRIRKKCAHQGISKISGMKKTGIYICIIVISSIQVYAQRSAKELKGDRYFSAYFFNDAISSYNQADTLTTDGFRNLATSYTNIGNTAKAEETYQKFINGANTKANDYINYAAVLKSNGRYEEADKWMNRFAEACPGDLRSKEYFANRNMKKPMADEGRYKIEHLSVNTDQDDFGAAFYKDKIVFTSSRPSSVIVKRSYNWNNKPFLDLYVADVVAGQLQNPRSLNKVTVNKKLHEGPASFNAAGTLMAFTRNNYDGKSRDGIVKLQLFFSQFENGQWIKQTPFVLNSPEYSVGHPSLTADGNTLFFASDMPGGFGGTDLYKIRRSENGDWGKPENLGSKVNTEGNEMFPFFQEKMGTLFFASDGHPGLGGLDIFLSHADNDGQFKTVMNAGLPLNTRYDDFALVLDSNNRGYFSSNRPGSGGDDLYSVELLKPFVYEKVIAGVVKDKSGTKIEDTFVKLTDENGKQIKNALSDSDGSFSFHITTVGNFKLNGAKKGYQDVEQSISLSETETNSYSELILESAAGFSLYGLIVDKASKLPLEGVTVKLTNNATGTTETLATSAKGEFLKVLNDARLNDKINYTLTLSKSDYLTKSIAYNKVLIAKGQYNITEEMDLTLNKVILGADLATLIDLKPIYFDVGKYTIRDDARIELNKIIQVMNENPTLIVELGSHTDCRSSAAANAILSDKRAKASAAYIKEKITNPERIYGKGYGETRLKNGCACEDAVKSPCTEQQHQENRRTEFIIIKI